MRNKFLFFALALTIFFGTRARAAIHTVAGDLRIVQVPASGQYPARTIRVWLPSDYEKAHRRYPVLYMMDGQNCFDRATSAFGKEWQIDETLTQLIDAQKLPPLIVVGIDNSPSRIDEYTFFADPKYGGGHGQAYADLVIHRILPFVEKSFRVETDTQHIFIGGSSLGALAALEIARRNPHTFAGVIAMSPSLWWDHHATISELNRDPGGLAQAQIWLDVGTDEDEANSAAPVDDVKALDAVLTKHQIKHHLLIVPGAHHDEIAWANRFGDAIKFLMGASLAAK